MTQWWGEPWPREDYRAAVCENDFNRIPVPVGEPCWICLESITDTDAGVTVPHIPDGVSHGHITCFLRSVVGLDIDPYNPQGERDGTTRTPCRSRQSGT